MADDGSVWVGTDRHYVLTFTDGLWSRTRMPVPAKVEDEETGIEGDPDWSIWKVAAYSGAIEVTAHWWDELDGSDGIYDWHVYRTPVNAEPEAVSRPSEGL
ncbi:hypothetical protein [Actinocorallia libanotica]|uniref:hypothetical protein n=1 Tax=Actinocorallia libanotica TaxID=46162 RepID=UPI0031D49168